MSETPGQNGQPSATQQDLDVRSPSRGNKQEKIIGGKFAYELSADGKPKNKLVSSNDSKDGLFIGTLVENGSPCVIRRYDTNDSDAKNFMRDLEALQTKKNLHENFIRYFGKVEEGLHTYYAFEKCRYSVEEVIRNGNNAHVWKTLSREKIMYQTTLGLDYLHGLGFIHRNIHARNVLLAEISTSSDTHYVVKLSDFRFGKAAQNATQNSLTKSSSGWIAPEMTDSKAMLGPWTDVFILGCFFYYVLSGGHHPFGRNIDNPNRETNILKNKPNWAQHTDDKNPMIEKYLELMMRMTSFNARDRLTTGQILRHFDTKEYYDMYPEVTASTTGTGLCVIFHQDQFDNPMHNLPGYRKDVKSLCKTFWQFGYDLRIYADLTAQGLLQIVKNLAEEKKTDDYSIFKDYASLVVCILSHGGPGTVEGIDGRPVNVSELQWAFSRETCPDLQNKAKIFFIQACQGGKAQNRKEYSDEEACAIYKKLEETTRRNKEAVAAKAAADVPVTNKPLNNSCDDDKTKQPGADVQNTATMMKAQFSDVVTMWATIVDYESYVYPNTGSSFIQSLCYHLVESQGGTKITGGDRIRDLHNAHLAITQEVSSQPIYVGWRLVREFDLKTGKICEYYKYEYVNQTPLYMSTACGKKVGFQVVAKEKRCKQIDCYGANTNYVFNIFDNSSASSTSAAADASGAFRVFLGANKDDALDLVLYPHTTSAHTVISMDYE